MQTGVSHILIVPGMGEGNLQTYFVLPSVMLARNHGPAVNLGTVLSTGDHVSWLVARDDTNACTFGDATNRASAHDGKFASTLAWQETAQFEKCVHEQYPDENR